MTQLKDIKGYKKGNEIERSKLKRNGIYVMDDGLFLRVVRLNRKGRKQDVAQLYFVVIQDCTTGTIYQNDNELPVFETDNNPVFFKAIREGN